MGNVVFLLSKCRVSLLVCISKLRTYANKRTCTLINFWLFSTLYGLIPSCTPIDFGCFAMKVLYRCLITVTPHVALTQWSFKVTLRSLPITGNFILYSKQKYVFRSSVRQFHPVRLLVSGLLYNLYAYSIYTLIKYWRVECHGHMLVKGNFIQK